MKEEFDFYTVLDMAQKTGESIATIRRRIEGGVIKAVKTRLGYLVTPQDLADYLIRRGPKNGRGYFSNEQLMPEDPTTNNNDTTNQEEEK